MSVCYKCTERTIGCHSTCEKYLAEVAENETLRKKRAGDADYAAYLAEVIKRRTNDKNRKR